MRRFEIEIADDQVEQFLKAWRDAGQAVTDVTDRPAYKIPGPYDIALAMGPAMAATGRFDTPGAAWVAAWGSIPEFYAGRDFFQKELAPILFGQHAAAMNGGEIHDAEHQAS